jgi:hypothetical protein
MKQRAESREPRAESETVGTPLDACGGAVDAEDDQGGFPSLLLCGSYVSDVASVRCVLSSVGVIAGLC